MRRNMKRRPPPVGFDVTCISLSPEHLQELIHKNRCEAVEAYKERLIMEMTAMSTPKQLGVVERAIKRIENFI